MQVLILSVLALASGAIVPMPQDMDLEEDTFFEFSPTTPIIVADHAAAEDLACVKALVASIGFDLPIVHAGEIPAGVPGFYIGEAEKHAAFEKRKVRKHLEDLDPAGPEGYRVIVNRDLVIVAGTDPAGTANGVGTLTQLLSQDGRVQCAEIRDEPDVPIRGVLVRGTPGPDLLQDVAKLKCNMVVFESPDFCALKGATAATWKDVFAEARARSLRPVPMLRTDAAEGLLLPLTPQLPTGRRAREEAFKALAQLRPAAILIEHTWPDVLLDNAAGPTRNQAFRESVRMLADIAASLGPPIPLMLLPKAKPGQEEAIQRALTTLPKGVELVLVHETGPSAQDPREAIARAERLGTNWLALCPDEPAAAYGWCEALAATASQKGKGLLVRVDASGVQSEGASVALRKAWSVKSPKVIWPEGLNAYFGAHLWLPSYAETLDAIAAHLDRQALRQVELKEESKRFEAMLKGLHKRLPEAEPELEHIEAMFENLLAYQELEKAFSEEQSGTLLSRLVELVEHQATLNPDRDPDRVSRIAETISGKGLFVPSTILFGRHILPHRAMVIPRGHAVFEVPATPTFRDTEHTAEATFDFLTPPGPICRVDFETVGTAKLTVARSDDGEAFRTMQTWTSKERGGVRGPALMQKPFLARYLRVAVEAPAERAVLRYPRVFALKGPAVAVCRRSSVGIVLDAAFKERVWPLIADVEGFVCADTQAFAEAQTTGRLCRDDKTLYIGLYAREPRLDTMAADRRVHDDALWEEESLTILIDTGKGGRYQFSVNPLGTRFESRNGDSAWNGGWEAAVRMYSEGWAVELAIPFAVLGGEPPRDRAWNFDFKRTRNNVKREESAWAYPTEQGQGKVMGDVIFN